jgi:hypothetical protein
MRLRSVIVSTAVLLASTTTLLASGSYPPNPPRLGGTALAKIDARTYNLGKTLFTDRLTLPETPPPGANPAANLARLADVQGRLPGRVRAEVDLTALATRLDSAQVDAVLYYVGIRFRVAIENARPPAS